MANNCRTVGLFENLIQVNLGYLGVSEITIENSNGSSSGGGGIRISETFAFLLALQLRQQKGRDTMRNPFSPHPQSKSRWKSTKEENYSLS